MRHMGTVAENQPLLPQAFLALHSPHLRRRKCNPSWPFKKPEGNKWDFNVGIDYRNEFMWLMYGVAEKTC